MHVICRPEIKSSVQLPEPVCAREFCRIWFGLDVLNPEDRAEAETESGYRKTCVKLLAKVIGVDERTVRTWGKGLNFERMPECHRKSLGYALFWVRQKSKFGFHPVSSRMELFF